MKLTLNLLWLAALAAVCPPTFAANPQATVDGDRTLTVLVRDYTGLPDSAAHDMETLAGYLLSRTGVQLEWVWCNEERHDPQSAMCHDNLEPGRILLRILADYPGNYKKPVHPLGSAEFAGSFASLYLAEIRKTSDENGVPFGYLTGYAAAHEIGHLLMGNGHSRTGVMRAQWVRADYDGIAQRRLIFSEAEGEAMRRSLLGTVSYSAKARPGTAGRVSLSQRAK